MEIDETLSPYYLVFATDKGNIYALDEQKKQNSVTLLGSALGIITDIQFHYKSSLMFVAAKDGNATDLGKIYAYKYKVTLGSDNQVHFALSNSLQKIQLYSGNPVRSISIDQTNLLLYGVDNSEERLFVLDFKRLTKQSANGFSDAPLYVPFTDYKN